MLQQIARYAHDEFCHSWQQCLVVRMSTCNVIFLKTSVQFMHPTRTWRVVKGLLILFLLSKPQYFDES